MPVRIYESLEDLPASYDALFKEAGRRDFFQSRAWFANLIATALEPDERPRLYGLEDDAGTPQALLICLWRETKWLGLFTKRELRSCTSMYSVSFAPICRDDAAQPQEIAAPLVKAIVGDRPWDQIQFDCWPKDSPLFNAFAQSFRRNGFWVQTYFHFGTWYERVAGEAFESYLAKRPSQLRNTLRRKGRKLDALEGVRYELISEGQALGHGIAAYQKVYAASWKQSEPQPDFMEGLLRAAAAGNSLRLGVLWIGKQPVAVQAWILSGGRATIFKLAHREDRNDLSPGSLLTLYMARQGLKYDNIERIDFGRGDDRFKKQWLAERHENFGLLAVGRRSPCFFCHTMQAAGLGLKRRLKIFAILNRVSIRSTSSFHNTIEMLGKNSCSKSLSNGNLYARTLFSMKTECQP